jgi:hypothetical protein
MRSRFTPKRLGVLLLLSIATLLAPAPADPSAAATRAQPHGCAALVVAFSPRHVAPGNGIDLDASLSNCSSETETLVLHFEPRGRCPFVPASTERDTLGPDQGFGTSALFLAPECSGHYRLKVSVAYLGRVIARDVTGFTVLPAHH